MKKLIFVLVFLVALELHAEGPEVVLFRAHIEYPLEARQRRITGNGTYVLNIDRNGLVTSVLVGQSSGSSILDGAAIRSFKKFRFKPGTKPRVRVPCSWSLPGSVR